MEQYLLKKEQDWENLEFCLSNYTPERFLIKLVHPPNGSWKSKRVVDEDLEGRTLKYIKFKSRLNFYIDEKRIFEFSLDTHLKDNEFKLAYHRKTEEGKLVLADPFDPYDPKLPEPKSSTLRRAIDNHELNIFFSGRVNLEFDSWKDKPNWKYYKIV